MQEYLRSYSKETVVMRKSFVKGIQGPGRYCPSNGQLQNGYDQSRGLDDSQVPVGKILAESVSRISPTVLCSAVRCSSVQFSTVQCRAVAVRAGEWGTLLSRPAFTLITSARVDTMSLACQ